MGGANCVGKHSKLSKVEYQCCLLNFTGSGLAGLGAKMVGMVVEVKMAEGWLRGYQCRVLSCHMPSVQEDC